MSNQHKNTVSNVINIQALLMEQSSSSSITQYTAGLKALLDVLPENTSHYPVDTIDNYLWVIEVLLTAIYQLLEQPVNHERGQ